MSDCKGKSILEEEPSEGEHRTRLTLKNKKNVIAMRTLSDSRKTIEKSWTKSLRQFKVQNLARKTKYSKRDRQLEGLQFRL